MSHEQLYQRCVGGHFHPVKPLPIVYRPLAEIDLGDFPARNLLPDLINECPMLTRSTTGTLTNLQILAHKIQELERERDQLQEQLTSQNISQVNHIEPLEDETVVKPSQGSSTLPPGLSLPPYLEDIPEEDDNRPYSPVSSTSTDHLLPVMPELIELPDLVDRPRLNLDDRTYATLRHSIPSKYRVRRLVKIPFQSLRNTWLTMAIDINVPFSIAHPDFPNLVRYQKIVQIKPCDEIVNWFLDRTLTAGRAITQVELPVEYLNQRDTLRFTFKLANNWTEPHIHAILGSDFFSGNSASMYESYISFKKGTYKPIRSRYEILNVVNMGNEYPREKDFLIPEFESGRQWTVIHYTRPPTPPLKRSTT